MNAPPPRRFDSYSEARDKFRQVLDAADSGVVTSLTRGSEKYVVVAAPHQRRTLAELRPANARVVAEGGGWAVILPGLPVHGDGATFGESVADAIEALREYADDWNERLRLAPNHAPHRAVVELVELSTDEELRDWVLGASRASSDDSTKAYG